MSIPCYSKYRLELRQGKYLRVVFVTASNKNDVFKALEKSGKWQFGYISKLEKLNKKKDKWLPIKIFYTRNYMR